MHLHLNEFPGARATEHLRVHQGLTKSNPLYISGIEGSGTPCTLNEILEFAAACIHRFNSRQMSRHFGTPSPVAPMCSRCLSVPSSFLSLNP